MRKHLEKLLGYNTIKQLVEKFPPLTEDEMEGYGVDDEYVVCDVNNFRIDFIHGWQVLPLNREARHVFVQHSLSCVEGGSFGLEPDVVPCVTYELVRPLLV